jgi:hypothetical protein
MRVERRRLAAGELDAELLGLGVLGSAGALGLAWLALGLPTPKCLFHAATGLPCLTCGGTRCVKNLLAGHVGAALEWNPLVFLGLGAVAVFLLYAALALVFRLPRVRVVFESAREVNFARLAAALALAANWIYLIFRFSRGA